MGKNIKLTTLVCLDDIQSMRELSDTVRYLSETENMVVYSTIEKDGVCEVNLVPSIFPSAGWCELRS